MLVVALVPDLLDRSRVEAAARAAGHELRVVRDAAALTGAAVGADLVLLDLGRPGALEALETLGARSVGFASHVDGELLRSARAAGCTRVLARSAFFARLGELLGGPEAGS